MDEKFEVEVSEKNIEKYKALGYNEDLLPKSKN